MNRPPLAASPLLLVLALAAGAGLGAWAPFKLTWLGAAGQAYIAVLNMVALPLIVLAVGSGLRQWSTQPRAAQRLVWLAVAAIGAMALLAAGGAVLTLLVSAGHGIGVDAVGAMGRLALEVEPRVVLSLSGPEAAPLDSLAWDDLVPDNGYAALAYGTLASALIAVLFLGIGLATQAGERSRSFLALAEGTYRSLETLVERSNRLLPFFAFALAAWAVQTLGLTTLVRMQGFLWPYALAVGLAIAGALAVVAVRLRQPGLRVLGALRVPMVVCLFSSGPAAAVPSLIDAMCNQLGFRRDLLELVAPVLPVFLRVGDALFLAVLAVFVAHVYGKPLTPLDLLLIALAVTAVTLASVALASGWSLAAASLLLAWLELPFEALLPTFVLLEVVTAGLRTLVSVMAVAPLAALVARDLVDPAQRRADMPQHTPPARYGVVLRQREAMVLATLLALALLTTCLVGVGVGLREVGVPGHDVGIGPATETP